MADRVYLGTVMRDVPDVGTQPEFDLSNWAVIEMPDGIRFFIGDSASGSSLRVSTPIVELDEFAMTGRTSSGRVYRLVGEPREDPLEDPVFRVHAATHGIDARSLTVVEMLVPTARPC